MGIVFFLLPIMVPEPILKKRNKTTIDKDDIKNQIP